MKKAPPSLLPTERRRSSGRRIEDLPLPDYRDLIDNAIQGVLIHTNFKPLYANAACAKLFGFDSAEQILDMPLVRPLVPDDLWAQVEQSYDDLVRGLCKPGIFRIRALRRDGKEIWLSVAERLIDWYGTPAVQMSAYDITQQIATEQRMLDNEQLLRSMLEILPVPIYIARQSDGRVMFVNRKTCLLLQQSAGKILRGRCFDYFVNAKDYENLQAMLEMVHDMREVEVRMKTAQGTEFTAELAAIMMDYGGQPAVLVALNDISHRKKLEAELFHQASYDELTGVSNRRYFLMQAEQEMRRARRFGRAMALLMIDIDHFKPINDKFGHASGDAVLSAFVKISLESLRQSDIMGRLGGEEFGVILPETGMNAALDVANRLRQHLSERPIVTPKATVKCTVSIGVTQLREGDSTIDDVLARADEALYRAKDNGRDRVEVAT